MRFLLSAENRNEINSRMAYLYDIFKVWFIKTHERDGFIILQTFPFTYEIDILIFYGHNNDIKDYIYNHEKMITENNVFIISCALSDNRDYIVLNKKTYLSINSAYITHLLAGKEYNFDFDITECELNLYNNSCIAPLEKLKSSFIRIKKGKRKK